MISSRFLDTVVLGLVWLVMLPLAFGQQGGQTGGGAGGGGTGAPSRGSVPKPPPIQPQPTNPREGQNNPPPEVFIFGTVVQEDGSPLPMGVEIERVCSGRAKREATVDSTGHFSFQVGGLNNFSNVIPEASDDSFGPGFGNRGYQQFGQQSSVNSTTYPSLAGCELRARLTGYRSSAVILQGPYTMGQIDVGTILLSPISKVSGTLVSVTNLQAPKAAQKSLDRAQKAFQKKNFTEAEKDLNSAVEVYPNYAAAWYTLGQVYQQQKRNEEARKAYSRAVAADGKYVSPYIQLALLAGLERNWQEVAQITDHALQMDPIDFPEGYFYNSLANYNLKNLDAAEKSAWKTERLDGMHRYPQVHLMLANILQQKQDFAGSIDQLQKYLKLVPAASNAEEVRSRIQDLEKSSKAIADKQPARP